MEPGNKKYAVEPGTGRRVLVEAYGDKLENLGELGYRMLSDEEIAAQAAERNSGAATPVLSSTTAKAKTEPETTPETTPEAPGSETAVTWDDVTKPMLDAYAASNNVADYPKSATKDEKIAALGDGVTPADVKDASS